MTDAKLIYQKPKNEEELRSCAIFQRKLFEILVKDCGLMWDEILFPCADSRSVTVAQSLGETSVFGSHAIISISDGWKLEAAAKSAAEQTGCSVAYRIKELDGEPDAIEKALKISLSGFEGLLICGDFSSLAKGSDENWKIRDISRKFLSFIETANDRAGKSFAGILGGRAVFSAGEERSERISALYESKTGTKSKIKIHKAVRRA